MIIGYKSGIYEHVSPEDCVALMDTAASLAVLLLKKGIITEQEFLDVTSTNRSKQELSVAEPWHAELMLEGSL